MGRTGGSDSRKLGVGIIGCGDGGMSNARSLIGIKDVRIVGFYDLNGGRLAAAVREFGGQSYSELAVMLGDSNVELVVVATPDDQHLAPTKAALEAGKHVFLEKPVATTVSDLREIGGLAEKHPRKLWFSEKYSFAYPVEAALAYRAGLGEWMIGVTSYIMWRCGRIMGPDGWRVNSRYYNPIAGGLAHNFMTAFLFSDSKVHAVSASGWVLTYDRVSANRGFDTAAGVVEFKNGRQLQWNVCLAIEGDDGAFAHRTVAHQLQFRRGALVYGPRADGDRLVVNGRIVPFQHEPFVEPWGEPDAEERLRKAWSKYNIGVLYRRMHENILAAIATGRQPRHTIEQGINVAAACALAFESTRQNGKWLEVPL